MRVDLFDFTLPEERIALRPVEPRDSARMLVAPLTPAPFQDVRVGDLASFLRPGDALVVNDTRVLPARLDGLRLRGDNVARVEATLHKRAAPDVWRAFLKPGKRVAVGDDIRFGADSPLNAQAIDKSEGGDVALRFDCAGAVLDAAIMRLGRMPLPPYIASRRAEDAQDERDYQTLFAREPGAVAAPTASLHFTPALIAAIEAAGVAIYAVTLHVGAGTFLPVKAEDTDAHVMHAETGVVSAETAAAINTTRDRGGRIVCAGTTSLRILESATNAQGVVAPFAGDTSIFITPGYRFRAVDMLLTNFHLPRSTLFMLVAAFAGLERMRAAYAHAIEAGYRFYSYGDACLLYGEARRG